MSRTWPTTGAVTDYLWAPDSTVFSTNTNTCLMAIINSPGTSTNQVVVYLGVPGNGAQLRLPTGSGVMEYVKLGVAVIDGTALTANNAANAWQAVMASSGNTTALTLKRYIYSNATLLTETVANAGAQNTPITAGERRVRLGNVGGGGADATEAFRGIMDRAMVGRGVPSDFEFVAWARNGITPPALTANPSQLAHWILSPTGVATDPEVDLGSNGLNIAGANIAGATTGSAAWPLPGGPYLVGASAAIAASATSGTGGRITPAFPAGYTAVADDIAVILAHHSSNAPFTTPTGYTIATDGTTTLDDSITTVQRVTVFWRRLQAGDTAQTIQLTTEADTNVRGAILLIVRGCVTSGTPFERCAKSVNTTAAATIIFPAITTLTDYDLLLGLGAYEDDPTLRTTPTNWSQYASSVYTSALGNGMALNYFVTHDDAFGANGSVTTTVSGGTFTNSPSVGDILAFKPAVAVTTNLMAYEGQLFRRLFSGLFSRMN